MNWFSNSEPVSTTESEAIRLAVVASPPGPLIPEHATDTGL